MNRSIVWALYTVVAPDIRNQWMSETVAAAGRQIMQTERFAKLCETLQEHGIRYVVLKGIPAKSGIPSQSCGLLETKIY